MGLGDSTRDREGKPSEGRIGCGQLQSRRQADSEPTHRGRVAGSLWVVTSR